MAIEKEATGSPDTDMGDTDTAEPLKSIDKSTGLRTGPPIAAQGGGIKKKRTPPSA
jgi:hypothetical protein